MSLEDRYRRRLRLFPKTWRAENEEEVLGVLLDSGPPDRAFVPFADTADLLVSALRIRARVIREVLSAATIALWGLSVIALVAVGLAIASTRGTVSPDFLATSLIVVLVPGTGVVYTVSSAISGGWRRGFIAAVGCTLGILPHLVAAMLGLSGVMQAGAAVFEIVRWVGVGYLVFMGVSMVRGGALQLGDHAAAVDERAVSIIRRGILLNVLNPKLTLFFFAFLPQFLDTTPRILDQRLILLAAVFMTMTLIVFIGYAYASSAVRDRVLESPTMVRWIQRALGTLLVGFAARLAVVDR